MVKGIKRLDAQKSGAVQVEMTGIIQAEPAIEYASIKRTMVIAGMLAYVCTMMVVHAEGLLGEDGAMYKALKDIADGIQPLLIPIAVISMIIAIICWINPFSQDARVHTRKIAIILGGVFLFCVIGALFNSIEAWTSGSGYTMVFN